MAWNLIVFYFINTPITLHEFDSTFLHISDADLKIFKLETKLKFFEQCYMVCQLACETSEKKKMMEGKLMNSPYIAFRPTRRRRQIFTESTKSYLVIKVDNRTLHATNKEKVSHLQNELDKYKSDLVEVSAAKLGLKFSTNGLESMYAKPTLRGKTNKTCTRHFLFNAANNRIDTYVGACT